MVKLPMKIQSIVNIRRKHKLCGTNSILAFLDPPRDDPIKVSNYSKSLLEIKKDGPDLADGLTVHDIKTLEGLNNLNINVFELNEYKILSHLYVSKT